MGFAHRAKITAKRLVALVPSATDLETEYHERQ